jgi:hypothetical protein
LKKFLLLLCLFVCGCKNAENEDRKHLGFISISMNDYLHVNGKMPANITDREGNPLLSWRVDLLQYGSSTELALYKKFKLDEPWNSPHNLKVAQTVPFYYVDPKGPKCKPVQPMPNSILWTMDSKELNYTPYLGVTGDKAAFRPEPRDYNENDLFTYAAIVVVDKSDVLWTEPRDIAVKKVEKRIRWCDDKSIYINSCGGLVDRIKYIKGADIENKNIPPSYEFE